MTKRALALISGGLDSILAARLAQEQGVEVQGVAFVMGFATKNDNTFETNTREAAEASGIPVKFVDISKEFLEVLSTPRHGYGSNINPCIDCKILMLKKAKEMMEKEGYGFIITGEVLGERPMSQRRDALNMIRKSSGLDGFLLRPLSAKLLEETVPEKEGIVDRNRLMDIKGRSRKPQMALAAKYGIKKFAQPAGGCLLTDPRFAARVQDLMAHGSLDLDNIALLKYGRHFRIDERTKVLVGRDDRENQAMLSLKKDGDIVLRLFEDPGPYAILRGSVSEENIKKAAALVVSHSKKKKETTAVAEWWRSNGDKNTITVDPLSQQEIDRMRL